LAAALNISLGDPQAMGGSPLLSPAYFQKSEGEWRRKKGVTESVHGTIFLTSGWKEDVIHAPEKLPRDLRKKSAGADR